MALGDLHRRYVKGLFGPYSLATAEDDARVREEPEIEPISTEEYHRHVKGMAGKCVCGAGSPSPLRLDVRRAIRRVWLKARS